MQKSIFWSWSGPGTVREFYNKVINTCIEQGYCYTGRDVSICRLLTEGYVTEAIKVAKTLPKTFDCTNCALLQVMFQIIFWQGYHSYQEESDFESDSIGRFLPAVKEFLSKMGS